ncbi:MAG: hypothetical protein MZV64_49915 [Ignavibacteriales bacterium]|nr:hypothetical protein [Ignavibacteriales bacterium]
MSPISKNKGGRGAGIRRQDLQVIQRLFLRSPLKADHGPSPKCGWSVSLGRKAPWSSFIYPQNGPE